MMTAFKTPSKIYELAADKYICNKFGLAEFFADNYDAFHLKSELNVLDVGCGAFPIGIFLADIHKCKVVGVELNKIACSCVAENIKKYGLNNSATVVSKNFVNFMGESASEKFDLIVFSPPVNENISEDIVKKYSDDSYVNFDDEKYSYLINSWKSASGKDLTDYVFEFSVSNLNTAGCTVIVFCDIDCYSPDYIFKKASKYGFANSDIISVAITSESLGIRKDKKITAYMAKFWRA